MWETVHAVIRLPTATVNAVTAAAQQPKVTVAGAATPGGFKTYRKTETTHDVCRICYLLRS
jgi:hypothetical protein